MQALRQSLPTRADSAETFEELLDVAERLFAENGIENVPLTRIVARSGQKNRSALHYYFGSREGVVAAVLDRRLKVINAVRQKLLARVEASGAAVAASGARVEARGASVDVVVRAAIESLGDVVLNETWGARYISILAQVVFHPRLLGERDVDRANLSALRHSRQLIEAALPHIPPDVLSRRFQWVSDNCVVVFARWVRDTPAPQRTRTSIQEEIDQLVAYASAALAAPAPTPTTTTKRSRHAKNSVR